MTRYIKLAPLALLLLLGACEKMIDVKIPSAVYDAEKVFESEETTEAALRGIYQSMTAGGFSGKISPLIGHMGGLLGMSADELIRPSYSADQQLILDNNLNAEISATAQQWAAWYSYIYQCNRFIEGVDRSDKLPDIKKNQFTGEALFIRGLSYFYLTNVFKDVPMPLSSEHTQHSQLAKTAQETIYQQVELDLKQAIKLLKPEAPAVGKRFRTNHWAAKALLARVYLYQRKWEQSAQEATDVINSDAFVLEPLLKTFQANSREAIWQLDNPGSNLYSAEASLMSSGSTIYTNPSYRLTPYFISQFATTDLRLTEWMKLGTGTAAGTRAPRKLRLTGNTEANAVKEASTPLRLAELFLIRAEARAQLGQLEEAVADVDRIRMRAGAKSDADAVFQTLAVMQPTIQKAALVDFIYAERMRELFAENGHRWFDAKRSGISLKDFFGDRKPNIQETDAYFPIPLNDLELNTKLTQNDGY
ncbi:SusD family protein [Sphingobacterium nematocida]|uniref:SusD family protein n=1 Tax=Sphingobacterium nematocida TaxID=1513896 RepID=A0A1T5ATY5_9SPHI|nr:RagB/SusD family nutrient uptake outer membrane protein [Sphingobacterium nematocida]SKB38464.1 SusD family protein [Sphingobacterium nematocida]